MDTPASGDWAAQRLAAIVESSTDAIISKDLNGVVTSWNAGAERLFGYSADDMIGVSILRVIPADRHTEESHILGQIRRGEIVPPFDTQRQAKDGRLVDVSVTASPIRDHSGTIVGVSKIARDISGRVRAQAEQRASETLYRTLFEHAPDGIVIADPNSYYLDANAAMCRMLGYSRDEFIGLHASDIIAEAERPQIQAALDQIHAEHEYQRDWHFRRKDGSVFAADVRVTTLPDGNLLGIIRDITDRQEAERRIRYLNRTYAVLSDTNQMIVRQRNPQAILQEACKIAVEVGEFQMAWIAMVDPTTGTLAPAASAGLVDGYLDLLPTAICEPSEALPSVLAVSTGLRQVHNDIARDVDSASWRVEGLRRGYRAVAAFPLVVQGTVVGAVGLYAGEPGFFSAEELRLLDELVMDIGFALEIHVQEAERQRVDQALRDERNRAQRYLDTADVLLLALDATGRITLINRKGCDLLGYAETELVGRSWIETCVPQRLRQTLTQKLVELVAGGVSVFENPILTKSGDERILEWRNRLLRDDAGRITGTFSSGTDITERKRAEDALRVAEERMRFVLETAKVGIWDMDSTSGAVQWSETLEAHHGLTRGTFGRTFEAVLERVHPDDRAAFLGTVDKATRSGADFSIEYRTVWPDGTIRWLSGFGRIVVDGSGHAVRAVGIALDVTERHALEAQFQQAQKMEAVGRLAGGVAHDFNNLLTGILGYCELLLADVNPSDPMRTDLIEIQKAGASAASLTRQLLAFSRKQIIELTLLDLNTVISGVRGMLGRLLGEDIAISVILADEPCWLMADRGQLEQVLLNLAVNARDAMPLGGNLTIQTVQVALDEHYASTHFAVEPGAYAALIVTDTGTGMPPDVQARLFEPFFTTKEQGKGTGLGLATVHGIVSRTGGSIAVYSEVGRGTSFTVYFPRADAPAMLPGVPLVALPPAVQSHTVLVVEDADGLRALIRRLLAKQGYTVLVAAHADEARRLFDQHQSIDVLLTDVVMPGASGPELTQQLVRQRPGLKVIYMSGYTEDAIVQHGVLKPGVAFLNKPFSSETLVAKIRETLMT